MPTLGYRPFALTTVLAVALSSTVALSGTAASPAAAAPAGPADLRINEVDSQPSDWVEFYNPTGSALDVSGYEIRDNSDDHRWRFAEGAVVDPGGFLVVEESTLGAAWNDTMQTWEEGVAFTSPIGIGGADKIRLYDASGTLIDETYSWSAHAAVGANTADYTLAREVDGQGGFLLSSISRGATNTGTTLAPAVEVNEINSNGGPNDYIEVINTSPAAIDLSGWYVYDNNARTAVEAPPLPVGTVLAAGARFVFTEGTHFTFGLGNGDQARVYTGAGTLVDEHTYPAHAADGGVWSACPEGGDDFVQTARTPGAANVCAGGGEPPAEPGSEYDPLAWPGGAAVTVLDTAATFLEDSSGLDTFTDETGTYLYAVDNGTGRFFMLAVSADGSFEMVDGWEAGKRVRFQKDAGNASAAGPDAEGITVDGDGFVYVASERDNSAKAVNQDVILKVDPDAAGPDVVALEEWDITEYVPVGANLGIEAVEWVSDADLEGLLWDTAQNAAYDPADYPGHGDGLFFVAVEDGGTVHAFALSDGAATKVATFTPGLAGVMALDWDTTRRGLWTVCDDGCGGVSAFVEFTGSPDPGVTFYARPAGAPVDNAEGFATAPASLATNGVRPAWWFTDGVRPGALRSGTIGVKTAPQPLVAPTPTISGTARVGEKLTAKAGAWGPAPVTLSYQWLRDGRSIAGATRSAYVLTATDRTHRVSVRVTGAKAGYTTVSKTSAAKTVGAGSLTVKRPTITGALKVGRTVTVRIPAGSPSGIRYGVQWYRDGDAIRGATKTRYTLRPADRGARMTVKITGTKSGYTSKSIVSSRTQRVR